jgi:hypothetical protein
MSAPAAGAANPFATPCPGVVAVVDQPAVANQLPAGTDQLGDLGRDRLHLAPGSASSAILRSGATGPSNGQLNAVGSASCSAPLSVVTSAVTTGSGSRLASVDRPTFARLCGSDTETRTRCCERWRPAPVGPDEPADQLECVRQLQHDVGAHHRADLETGHPSSNRSRASRSFSLMGSTV